MNEHGTRKAGRHLPAEVKWHALQERRQAQAPVSQVCAKYDVRPNQLYPWEKTAERAASEALRGRKRGRKTISPREENCWPIPTGCAKSCPRSPARTCN